MQAITLSFHRLAQWADHPSTARRLVVAMLAVHSGLLLYSAYAHSPTLNEPAHLAAGLSHWKFGRFDLYRVNPPLVRLVAALPVIAAGYEEDWSGYSTGPDSRPVYRVGEDFVAANGPRTQHLTTIARWACLPFCLLGAITCYLWARDLYGRPAGLIACFIWCFEPNILAHGSLLTADAHATALGLMACYTFWRWLKKPSWTQAALTGVVLGLAELAKTTLILLYPLWPLLWLAYRWPGRASMTARKWLCEASMLALRMVIGLYVVNLGYCFEGTFQPLGEHQFVSQLFAGAAKGADVAERAVSNRFCDTPLSLLPVPFPRDYILGIDQQQKDFESRGRSSYLRGEWSDRGWWYYYLYAGLIKVPLGLLLLAVLRLFLTWRHRILPIRKAAARDTLVLCAPAVIIFCVVSSKTGFSEHFRYTLPALPFLFVWIAGTARRSLMRLSRKTVDSAVSDAVEPWNTSHSASLPLVPILLTWLATSSLWIYPHSLSYFNEVVGGPLEGSKHLLGSNLDWGQDLTYLRLHWSKQLRDSESAAYDLQLAFHGLYSPESLGLSYARQWRPSDGSKHARDFHIPVSEVCGHEKAISANLLHGQEFAARSGDGSRTVLDGDLLQKYRATHRPQYAGYSILLYSAFDDPPALAPSTVDRPIP